MQFIDYLEKKKYSSLTCPIIETPYIPNKIYNFFIEKYTNEDELKKEEITRFMKTGVNILVNKQQNK
jgi:hypothetical protein